MENNNICVSDSSTQLAWYYKKGIGFCFNITPPLQANLNHPFSALCFKSTWGCDVTPIAMAIETLPPISPPISRAFPGPFPNFHPCSLELLLHGGLQHRLFRWHHCGQWMGGSVILCGSGRSFHTLYIYMCSMYCQ